MTYEQATSLVVAVATLVGAVGALVVAIRTGQKIDKTHELVNGQSNMIGDLREAQGFERGTSAATSVTTPSQPDVPTRAGGPPKPLTPGPQPPQSG